MDFRMFEFTELGLKIDIERIKKIYQLCEIIDTEVRLSSTDKSMRSRFMLQIFNEHLRQIENKIVASSPEDMRPKCRKTCSFCCYQNVDVLDIEVEAIKTYVSITFTNEQKAMLLDRYENLQKLFKENPGTKRIDLKTPCCFLVDNKCSIYDARPMACRGYTSNNPELCESTLNADVPSTQMTAVLTEVFSLYQEASTALALYRNELGKTLEESIPEIVD